MTTFDEQGFPTAVTQQVGGSTAAKHYDDQGFLITTPAAPLDSRSTQAPIAAQKNVVSAGSSAIVAAADAPSSSSVVKTTSPPTGAADRLNGQGMVGAVLIVCGLLMVSEMFLL